VRSCRGARLQKRRQEVEERRLLSGVGDRPRVDDEGEEGGAEGFVEEKEGEEGVERGVKNVERGVEDEADDAEAEILLEEGTKILEVEVEEDEKGGPGLVRLWMFPGGFEQIEEKIGEFLEIVLCVEKKKEKSWLRDSFSCASGVCRIQRKFNISE
jgi:hypothetical protein